MTFSLRPDRRHGAAPPGPAAAPGHDDPTTEAPRPGAPTGGHASRASAIPGAPVHDGATPSAVRHSAPTPPPTSHTTAWFTPPEREAAETAVSLRAVTKTYPQPRGTADVHALAGVDLDVPRGRFVAVVGPSGSGKSTLLHCASGLDRATSGSVVLAGMQVTGLSARRLAAHRCAHVGFVFQEYNLVSSLTAAENIALPTRLAGRTMRRADVLTALERVGLAHRADLRPGRLSGGERQRVAVARVLAGAPDVVFADEPTGALDVTSGGRVLDWLAELPSRGTTVVMVTHDPRAAARAQEVVVMASGRVAQVLPGGDDHAVADAVLAAQEVGSCAAS